MKRPSLKLQISAVQQEIDCLRSSFTHYSGKWKGKIPPGKILNQVNALKAAVKTLRGIKPTKKAGKK